MGSWSLEKHYVINFTLIMIKFKSKIVVPFLLGILGIVSSSAQNWRSSLYPENWTPPTNSKFYTDAFIQDYSYAGYHQGEKEIPTISKNIIDVTKAPYFADASGLKNATLAIQAAINDAQKAGGGVVYLPKGTFKVNIVEKNNFCLKISSSNIVFRGAGVNETFLYNETNDMTKKSVIEVGSNAENIYNEGKNVTKITKDLDSPTMIIPLENTKNFRINDWVIVRNSITDEWALEHNESDWVGYGKALKGIIHIRKVTAIDAINKTITIDAPIRYALKTRDEARVYLAPKMISEVGLEGFSLGNREVVTNELDWLEKNDDGTMKPGYLLDDKAHNTTTTGAYKCYLAYLVRIEGVTNSWVRNVSTYQPEVNKFRTHMLSCGILVMQSRGVTIDNVSLGYAQYGAGANGYGFRIESNDCLLKNCTTEVMRHGFVFSHMYAHGNVIHDCTDKFTGLCTANSAVNVESQSSTSDFHMHFSPSNLIDKCTFIQSSYSARHRKGVGSKPNHNSVTAHTTFWNTVGQDVQDGWLIRSSQSRYGYIIGTSGNSSTVNYKVSQGGPAFEYDKDGTITAPEDIVEGMGKGKSLEPQSLYLDQLQRRLSAPK